MNNGRAAVIVEDDFAIADDLRMIRKQAGATVMDVLNRAEGAAEPTVGLGARSALRK